MSDTIEALPKQTAAAQLQVTLNIPEYLALEDAADRHRLSLGAMMRRAVVLFLRAEGAKIAMPDARKEDGNER